MATPLDYAWAAGFFDGEGCVHIRRQEGPRSGRGIYCLMVQVTNKNRASVDRFVDIFGGRVRIFNRKQYPGAPYYEWRQNGQEACAALVRLLPYLINKQEVALFGIAFSIEYARLRTNTRVMSDERRRQAEFFRQACLQAVYKYRLPAQGRSGGSPSSMEEEALVKAG